MSGSIGMSRRRFGQATLGWAAALGLEACAPRAGTQAHLALDAALPEAVPPGTQLTIGDPATQWVLEHTGWVKDLPFTVNWARIVGGPEVTEAFNAKALDVGLGANVPPIHAVWVGIPVKIITFRTRRDPFDHPVYVIGVSPKARIDALGDLRGKKIAYSPSQIQSEVVIRTLKAVGLTPHDVQLVELPSTGEVYTNALASGLIDAAPIGAGIVSERYLRKFAGDGAKVLHHPPFRDDAGNAFVRVETLEDPAKAAALKHYVRAWGRALAWTQTHRQAWVEGYYVKDQGLSPADAALILNAAGVPDVPVNWDGAVAYQQSTIDLMATEHGQKPFDAETLFDRRFQALAGQAYLAGLKADA